VNVIVDTSVWSLALRRSKVPTGTAVLELAELVREGRVVMLGLVRQELLSGIKDAKQFHSLRDHLLGFVDLPIETADHEEAAAFFNLCRAKGIQGSTIDFLICAVAFRRKLPILTTDGDFSRYARLLTIKLHLARLGPRQSG
jgi:predicted nucleic acid-binding protein